MSSPVWPIVGRGRYREAMRMAVLWKQKAREFRLRLHTAELQAESSAAARRRAEAGMETAAKEISRLRETIETMTDNALFGSGHAPVFHPEAERFRPRPKEIQTAEASRPDRAANAAEWRRRVEDLDRQAAERDRKGRLSEELQQLAKERQAASV